VTWIVVLVGGAVGAPARYLADQAITRRSRSGFPWGTLCVNITGSLLLGVLAALTIRGDIAGLSFAAVGTGFCGAFTTFSTFTWEALALAEEGMLLRAAGYAAASLFLGIGAAALGYLIAS